VGVVVGNTVFPATKGDSDPFESQCPDGGVMVFSAIPQETVVSGSPVTEADRVSGPFVKGLTEKARAGPANVNPFGLAAALGNGSDSGERLQVRGTLVAVSLRSEGSQQTRSERRASAGKRIKDDEIGVYCCRLSDLTVEAGDPFPQRGDQLHKDPGHCRRRLDQSPVTNGGDRLADRLQSLFDQLLAATVVLGEEGANGFDKIDSPLVADLLKRWPTLELLQKARPATGVGFTRACI
jgi:hypothetical protein